MPRDFPLPEPQKPKGPAILKCEMGCCRGLPEHQRRTAIGRVYMRPACMEALADHHNATVAGQIRYERVTSYNFWGS